MSYQIIQAISSKNNKNLGGQRWKALIKAYRMHVIKEIARAFYKDNEDQRFIEAPPNKEGFIIGGFQSDDFRRLLYDKE